MLRFVSYAGEHSVAPHDLRNDVGAVPAYIMLISTYSNWLVSCLSTIRETLLLNGSMYSSLVLWVISVRLPRALWVYLCASVWHCAYLPQRAYAR